MGDSVESSGSGGTGSWNRRDVLRAGTAGLSGLALTELFRPEAAEAGRRREKNCIFIMCVGGPAQHDTWDPKPLAPSEIRGPYRPIETSAAGIRISETLPRLARQAHRYALVRSVHHDSAALHETGAQLMQTGTLFSPGHEWPHFGSVVSHLYGGRLDLPAHVLLPRPLGFTGVPLPQGQHGGFLGRAFDPLVAVGDPNEPNFNLAHLRTEPAGQPVATRAQRRDALRSASAVSSISFETGIRPRTLAAEATPAYDLLASPGARAAFDLRMEPDALRDSYGRSTFGQSCLLARRLVENGVRFVTLNQFDTIFNTHTWDCHGYPDLPTRVNDVKERVAAPFDQAVAALIDDLCARGMWEDTLVCCFGEFGRTPHLTPTGGRDHHTGVWSVMLGGGGLRGGQVIGASDAHGAEPADRPVSPAMLAATVYQALGISPATEIPGPEGRPVRLVSAGAAPIRELF